MQRRVSACLASPGGRRFVGAKSARENQHAYSIPRKRCFVTRHIAQVRSDEDGHYLALAEDDVPNWEGIAVAEFT